MAERDKAFIEEVISAAKEKYAESIWVLLWADPNDKHRVSYIADEELPSLDKSFRVYRLIGSLLQFGKLNGCDLRGNKDTGQFGLVANKDLKPMTPVAVECGILWSERRHNKMLGKVDDPMIGLTGSEIPAHLFKDLVSKDVWAKYKLDHTDPESGRIEGFVIESSSHGNETRHIDDASWLHSGYGSTHTPANIEPYLILDLRRRLPTVMFFVKEHVEVKKGEELTMDWGCWKEISFSLLPSYSLMSSIKHKECDVLHKTCTAKNIRLPGPEEILSEVPSENMFFAPKYV